MPCKIRHVPISHFRRRSPRTIRTSAGSRDRIRSAKPTTATIRGPLLRQPAGGQYCRLDFRKGGRQGAAHRRAPGRDADPGLKLQGYRLPDGHGVRHRRVPRRRYYGWDDAEIPPALMLRYFDRLQATMGGLKSTREFARLFMLPGVAHCRRGPGADTADWLTYLERWVEQGQAPDAVDTYHLTKEQNYLGLPRPRFPLPAVAYDRVKTLQPFQ